MMGKGTNKIVEKFLKDSFDYQDIEIKKWNINKKLRQNFIQKKTKNTINLNISKPVYNLTKDKAIIYKISGRKKHLETTLYFLSKKNRNGT